MENVNTQKNENEGKTTKDKVIFGLKIAGNVVFYAVIIALFLFSIMNINAGSKNGGFPNIFGRGFLAVQTDSMKREEKLDDLEEWKNYKVGGFSSGDLVYVKVFKQKKVNELKVGDVVTFYDGTLNNGAGGLNTHRIVYIYEDKANIITQGDKRAQVQPFEGVNEENAQYIYSLEASGAIELVRVNQIKGVVTGVKVGGGKTIDNIHKNWLWYFVLPVLLFLILEVFIVVKNVMEMKGAKQEANLQNDKEAMLADIEAQKEEMRRQILAELQAQKDALDSQEEEPKEESQEEETVEESSTEASVAEETIEPKEDTDKPSETDDLEEDTKE